MAVVTVSRQFGAGETEFLNRLAERLVDRLCDRELIERAARELRIRPEDVVAVDEQPPAGLVERVVDWVSGQSYRRPSVMTNVAMPRFDPVSAGVFRTPFVRSETERVLSDASPLMPRPEDVRATLRQIIRELGKRGRVIIVGRGANFVLRREPDLLSIRFVAPLPKQVDRIASDFGISRQEAERDIKERDEDRRHFVRAVYDANWEDPTNYDVVLNTAALTIDGAVAVAADALQTKVDRLAALT